MNTIKYCSAQEISELWGISKRRVQNLCINNRISGAVRIGNMWAIPSNAIKPKDERKKDKPKMIVSNSSLERNSRRELRSLVGAALTELMKKKLTPADALHKLTVIFSSKLLNQYINDYENCLKACEVFFDCAAHTELSDSLMIRIDDYISKFGNCLDDALSWIYQFGSKRSDDFQYRDTQFFTEKYMISTLIDSLSINASSRIFDPACGGANFLLYSFETIANSIKNASSEIRARCALDRLFGYEIDSLLAYIATFNIKIKALSYIANDQIVSVNVFDSLKPNIYYPQNYTVSGSLDIDWEEQIVINCNDGREHKLADLYTETNVIVTNPPFRTIKGMPADQKEYLQKYFPLAKCDMCNAFIDRIMDVLPEDGQAAMVTQTSWMYLDSFASLRVKMLNEYTINNIWELGSNAFYDLSGEKANVALLTFSKKEPSNKHKMNLYFLRNLYIEQIEKNLKKGLIKPIMVGQKDILNNTESRFDMVSTDHLKELQSICEKYKDYAVPMQGTSTGDAKNLIDYFWCHFEDDDWVLVSKGGGYSRYEGLNSYCVKWGKDGEFIKETKGSAIRNANYFGQTQLVFSDTGTAGINVRLLMPGQIFVASGPGIRINKGNKMAHLAFLNSRFAAFYVRLASPKLTIAARYIGQIPVTEKLLNSNVLATNAERCIEAKVHRLTKRPCNIEFSYVKHTAGMSIEDAAKQWFLEDLNDELTQLLSEKKIEDEIYKEMGLSIDDIEAIDSYLGKRIIIPSKGDDNIKEIDCDDVRNILGVDCFPKRTKANKKALGSDGLIEYMSQATGKACVETHLILSKHFEWFKEKYCELYLHALILSALDYRSCSRIEISIPQLISEMEITDTETIKAATEWIIARFNDTHSDMFYNRPLFQYDEKENNLTRIVRKIQ